MPTDIQRGELVERLRTFAGTVGRLPLVLDEVVIPVINVETLAVMPYRRSARTFSKRCSRAALAANFSAAGVHLPKAAAGAAHVTGVLFENVFVTAGTQYALEYSQNPEGLTNYALQGGCVDLEMPGDFQSGVLRLTPVREFWAAAAALPSGTSEMIALQVMPTFGSFYLPIDVMLFPGYGLSVWCLTLATAVGASFFGEYFPDITQR